MGYESPDVYFQPEAFGLTKVGEVDDPEASYSFDLFVVWRDAAGKLYWSRDAGCSCPSPFEDFTSFDSLDTGTLDDLRTAALAYVETFKYLSDESRQELTADVHSLLRAAGQEIDAQP